VAAQGGRGEALAVTVATNEDARKVNQAVRELRVQSGQVDDTRVATGMGGERIGAGDRIVTRRNDTARNVANRETWSVEAVTADGTVLARGSGDRRVRLEAGYVAEAVQLGYVTTDYGNQGVTADRSLTWVTDATTAGGLYVGATRGRYANDLHVVATDRDAAHHHLVAVIGRDRADRGLDAARSWAEADAAAVQPERRAEREIDPADWASAAELDAAERAVETRYARKMGALGDLPVMADEVAERENQADRTAAVEARARAAQHRAEAERIAARRPELVEAATAEFFSARDDARIIAAGPGLLGRKAARVDQARARLAEVARRWGDNQLPGPGWSDQGVEVSAARSANRITDAGVRFHQTEAGREEQAAATAERRVVGREQARALVVDTNRYRSAARQRLVAESDAARAWIAQRRAARAELAETMTPDQVADADKARDALLAELARQRQLARYRQQARQAATHTFGGPRLDRGGPGIER
jgi:exodeoxyribonuclease V alpha subunit